MVFGKKPKPEKAKENSSGGRGWQVYGRGGGSAATHIISEKYQQMKQ